jgi:hypothetical protein
MIKETTLIRPSASSGHEVKPINDLFRSHHSILNGHPCLLLPIDRHSVLDLELGVDWIHLTQDSVQWRALVNTVMIFGVS